MDQIECAKAVADPIQHIGGKFMLDGATFAAAAEVGMEPSIGYYAVGRFGALGALSGEEALNHIYFVEPESYKAIWEESVSGVDPHKVADKFLECCVNWGRAHLTEENGVEESWLETFSKLGEKVVDGVSDEQAESAPLFAVLRKKERPADVAGRAKFIGHLLRELRLAEHVAAVKESGMSPLEAILSGSGGEANAEMFQFQRPYPEVTDEMRSARQEIEDKTDIYSALDFAVLSDQEMADFSEAAQNIFAVITKDDPA